MEIKWVQDFLSVARNGSFSRAAEERHISQSGLSRRIRALEAWLGVELIDRSVHPACLTEAGMFFRQHAEEVLHRLLDARAVMQGMPNATIMGMRVVLSSARRRAPVLEQGRAQ
jgi:DNA-binding transcriptional LysR family regulator